ncbi:hypothetical protein B0I35DRAFT_443313 [Stachybotrys elegans]|uniref:DUF676 domain-containing protein n=1 Tax=Stachybotrys elegans TaxID=80388 RepID=A0A8K0SF01_9HYPO|nr:hypothetical protein B0I35DRAFT_443313 [Stachybotrys elegans]
MSRVLLLCFIHGFKGTDNTFHEFPQDLKEAVGKQIPDHHVESIVYPKYETKGELPMASAAFLEWLKERVIETRKAHFDNPWPPHDNKVGVVLVAHSMGGFVAADALFLALEESASNPSADGNMFPLIQGILAFDTPYNGLSRAMFVYGAFSNYQKVNGVFNAMTALSAAAPATLSRLSGRSATAAVPTQRTVTASSSKWSAWQLLAVRTGTVGAIAAGGVAAYRHREAIMQGVQSLRGLNRESITEGYRQGLDTIGQGLAYINRGNVGKSFAWLSDHFTFVGALLKPQELCRRLDRLEAVKGVGIHDFYCSLGVNGYWSGGYFVPERTFCAVPETEESANRLFSRLVMGDAEDEVQAHMSLFKPKQHKGYGAMVDKSAELVQTWFLDESKAVDDARFKEKTAEEAAEDTNIEQAVDGEAENIEKQAEATGTETPEGDEKLPEGSPIDIAAAASMVPLPEDEGVAGVVDADDPELRKTYTQYLMQVAQQAGTGVKGWWPTKAPQVPTMPTMPTMPNLPSSVSSLTNVSIPGAGFFGKKKDAGNTSPATEKLETEKKEA